MSSTLQGVICIIVKPPEYRNKGFFKVLTFVFNSKQQSSVRGVNKLKELKKTASGPFVKPKMQIFSLTCKFWENRPIYEARGINNVHIIWELKHSF